MDKKTKHSDFPWTYGFDDKSGRAELGPEDYFRRGGTILNAKNEMVVNGGSDDYGVPLGVVGKTQEEAEANVELIITACQNHTRLLSILKRLVTDVEDDGVNCFTTKDANKILDELGDWE